MEWNEHFLPAFHFLSTNSQKGILKTISHSIPSSPVPTLQKKGVLELRKGQSWNGLRKATLDFKRAERPKNMSDMGLFEVHS